MADTKITEAELTRNSMRELSRIKERGETFVVDRNGLQVAMPRPMDNTLYSAIT